MRETKRQLSLYSFYDHTGIEAHLGRMAERGWLLCGLGQLLWHYRRIEPRQITFSVCYFPQATIYDPRPSAGQEEFYDLCAHAGWTLAGESGQLQVFYHQGEDPTPIDTDPALEVEAIHQSAKKTVLPANFLLLGVAVLNLGLFLWRFWDNPVLTLASGGTLLALVAYTLILVNCTVELCAYFRWRGRARRAAERGEFLPTRSRVWLQRLLLAILLPAGAWCFAGMLRDGLGGLAAVSMLGVIGIIAAVLGVRKLLKGAGVSAKANLRGTLAVCVVLSILFAYVTNRRWVFESKVRGVKGVALEMAKFFGARGASLVLDLAAMYLGVTLLRIDDKLMKLISNGIIIAANYVFSKLFVFKKQGPQP